MKIPLAHRSFLLPCLLFAALCAHAQPPYEVWQSQIRQALFIPSIAPALNARSFGSFSPAPGVIAERVTYATQFDLRVPAIIYSPARHGAKRLPALVIVNGHGGDKYSWYSFYSGILYARAGGVVLTYDPIGEGERNQQHKSGTRDHDRQIDGPHTGERMGGQMVLDVMQAASYLLQRPDVDPSRIAVAGYSMGSFVSVLARAIDPRIRVLVLSGGGDLDGNGGYWDTSNKLMCQALPYRALSFLPDKAAVLYALNQQHGPTFIMNGTADTVVDIPNHSETFFHQLRERVFTITKSRHNLFETYFIPGVSHRPSWVTRPAALWMQSKLHFPRWSTNKIDSLPETHISQWAALNVVDMDKGYIQEDREGGVLALGNDIPNVPRPSLDAVPEAEWQRTKSSYIYQSWVERALAADGLTRDAATHAIVTKSQKPSR